LQNGQFSEAWFILKLVSGFCGGSCVNKGELVGPAETDAGWLGPGKITHLLTSANIIGNFLI
jgi:hypothetical protein